ncbi:hypothetical protein JAAARDRAFT_183518 [Jaapia argillacea MUCL 33604]|uniref:AB hydrolase-1 domain-containing protein n=1 Tax=Jaapia argillacea MUCL 33604 TaxID=933084 RepID=A0A067PE46_9AGAM|nr:hypothetical protein JAAARDRAFT_183518 [Jaapia argillacea MUCL 33604]
MHVIDSTFTDDISERPLRRRPRDWSFYFVLICAVLPVWSLVPFSWIFITFTLYSGSISSLPWQGKALFVVALCEIIFSLYHSRLARRVSEVVPNPRTQLVELQSTFSRVLQTGLVSLPDDGYDHLTLTHPSQGSTQRIELHTMKLNFEDPRAVDFRNYLRTWFSKAPWSQIRTREIHTWLYWIIFNSTIPPFYALPEAHKELLDEVVQKIEMRSGSKIPKGSNPSVKPLLLTLDPINVTARPFVWYVCLGIVNWLVKAWYMYAWGAVHGCYNGLEYILYTPQTWSPCLDRQPIVFLYGLGLGLAQYNHFLAHLLRALPDCPVLIPLQPHISQDIFHARFLNPMGRPEMAECLAGLVRELGWVQEGSDGETRDDGESHLKEKGITVLSHSNGSYVHAWLLKAHPNMIARSCFVDPVTFCIWEGDVCYNFIYRPCSTGIELLMRYFVGAELGIANVLQRHFDWSSNSLWYEEIPNARDPNKTMFFLGGKDSVVDAERVKRYLSSHGIKQGLWFDPDGQHGQALLGRGPGRAKVIRWLRGDLPN